MGVFVRVSRMHLILTIEYHLMNHLLTDSFYGLEPNHQLLLLLGNALLQMKLQNQTKLQGYQYFSTHSSIFLPSNSVLELHTSYTLGSISRDFVEETVPLSEDVKGCLLCIIHRWWFGNGGYIESPLGYSDLKIEH